MSRPHLTVAELDTAWDDLVEVHREYLKPHGVQLPTKKTYQWVWLAVLFRFKDQCVHKDYISEATHRIFPKAGKDQQVRHLKRKGWNISTQECKSGEHKLDPYQPSKTWIQEQARRSARMNSSSFETLVKNTGSKCLTCGAKEGQPDTRYGDNNIQLQQGHMDPAMPASDLSSVIPQCQFCNQTYKNDFTFDKKGRVRAVASPEAVLRASTAVQREIYNILKTHFRTERAK